MYIHIGNRNFISVHKIIGIFNAKTLNLSVENIHFNSQINKTVNTVIINESNEIYTSSVSPFTVIKRTDILKESLWRKSNE